ncbi:MAG TPA: HNH endonuclease [Vicinamibacteria bacterium]|jgi:hypothetical protein
MHFDLALHTVPDDELLRRLHELAAHSRSTLADLVAHIGEVDERRLYARKAFPSMFAYCTQALQLSEAEAYRRITVARAARKHAVLLAMLRDGRIHLSGMALLVPLLTQENRDAVLERARHRSKRQIEELVAELSPRPDVPSVMRKLPQPRPAPAPGATQGGNERSIAATELFPGRVATEGSGPDASRRDDGVLGLASQPAALELALARVGAPEARMIVPDEVRSPPPVQSRRVVVEPLSPARYRVQFTASAELHAKLERLAALMRSEVPDGDMGAIIDRAVTEKLERLEARRFAASAAPRKALSDTHTSIDSRHIPAAVRRAVRSRDGDRCRFVDEQARRCSERHRLEFHHRRPYGMGGDHSPENISLLCPQHNRYLAERDYGQVSIRRRRKEQTQSSWGPAST